MDAVIITPEPGRHKDIGRLLLELATHPHEVQWVTWPVPGGYSVPLDLFQRFVDATAGEEAEEAESRTSEHEPRKRRRGRPRKEESSTDNDTSEEE